MSAQGILVPQVVWTYFVFVPSSVSGASDRFLNVSRVCALSARWHWRASNSLADVGSQEGEQAEVNVRPLFFPVFPWGVWFTHKGQCCFTVRFLFRHLLFSVYVCVVYL